MFDSLLHTIFPVASASGFKYMTSVLGYFFIPFTLSLFCATMVIYSQNPLWSILSFIGTILSAAIMLFYLEVEFLTFILMLVYIGAIAVLFLFIVMMLELTQGKLGEKKFYFLDIKNIFYLIIFVKLNQFLLVLNNKLWFSTTSFNYEFKTSQELWFITLGDNPLDHPSFYTPLHFLGGDSILFLNLFSQKYFYFILVGFVLLFAMVGAIALCVSKTRSTS